MPLWKFGSMSSRKASYNRVALPSLLMNLYAPTKHLPILEVRTIRVFPSAFSYTHTFTESQPDSQTNRQTGSQADKQTNSQAGRQAGRKTDRQSDRQTDRQ